MKKYQAIARKYRPQTFSEVVAQEAVVQTLKNALRFGRVSHAYLFCGSRGVGKTTLARLFAKALNCQALTPDFEPCNACPSCQEIVSGQSLDVIEIDGASNRGIDDIRQINETIGYAPAQGKYKIYIIDEVHMLTKEAFNALLKTLEEPPERAKFFFATTEAQKVLPTIVSRCQRFDLGRIAPQKIIAKLEQIAADLGRSVDKEALRLIAAFAEGGLRDAESILDQILCFTQGAVNAAAVRQSLGLVAEELFDSLDQAFSEARAAAAFEIVEKLFEAGKDLSHFLEQLIEHYRNIALYKTTHEKTGNAERASAHYTQSQALYILQMLIEAEGPFQKSAFQRVALESLLLRLIRSKNRIPVEVLVRRLSQIEEAMQKGGNLLQLPAESQEEVQASEPNRPTPPEPAKPSEINKEPVQSSPVPEVAKPAEINKAPEPVQPKPVAEVVKPVEVNKAPEPVQPKPVAEVVKPVEVNKAPAPMVQAAPVAKPLPEPVKRASVEASSSPTLKATPLTLEPKPASETPKGGGKHPSHYDTLMRFAAIELEGTLKTN